MRRVLGADRCSLELVVLALPTDVLAANGTRANPTWWGDTDCL